MPLILPNTIANGLPADGDQLNQNLETIEDYVNQEVISRDGSTAMVNPLLLPGAPTQPNQASTKAYADQIGANASSAIASGDAATLASANSRADTGDANTLASAKSYSDGHYNDLRARAPQVWAASLANAYPLAANQWSDFTFGPNWTAPYSAQYLITAYAMLGSTEGEVFLNFKIDGGGLSPISAQATAHNGYCWLVCPWTGGLGAGAHSIIVSGNTSGAGGSIRSMIVVAQSMVTS